jgi:PAS domain S-box-containing protein
MKPLLFIVLLGSAIYIFLNSGERRNSNSPKNTEKNIINRLNHISTVQTASRIAMDSDNVNSLGRSILQLLRGVIKIDAFSLTDYDSDNEMLIEKVQADIIDGQFRVWNSEISYPLADNPLLNLFSNGKPVLELRESQEKIEEKFVPFGDTDRRSASLIFAPMNHKGSTEGILSVQSYEYHAYSNEDLELIANVANVVGVAIKRLKVERDLQKNHQQLKAMFDTIPAYIIVIDKQFNIVEISDNNLLFSGRTDRKDIIGKKYHDIFNRKDSLSSESTISKVQETGLPETFIWSSENGIPGNGAYKVCISPIKDVEGIIWGAIECRMDISDLKQAEAKIQVSLQEKDVLLREIFHRVKNNLQTISGLIELQADSVNDLESRRLFQESQNRIKAMAMIHERLYQFKDMARIDFREYIESITEYLFEVYGGLREDIKLVLEVENISIGLDSAVPCGLIICELISNSLKHAFPQDIFSQNDYNEHNKEIRVRMKTGNHGNHMLEISDNGIGLPDSIMENPPSLGLQLINLLTRQIAGSLNVLMENGTTYIIEFAEDEASKGVKA